jgi:hypothetical protein
LDGPAEVPDNIGSVSFGTAALGVPVTKTFTVRNLGDQNVTLGAISVPAGFTLTKGWGVTTLAPRASTTFTVRLNAASLGAYSGTLSFSSNDLDENPLNFTIQGLVVEERIIDNGDPGFATAGSWIPYANQGYQDDVTYAVAGTGSSVATWTFTGLAPGRYRVSAAWSRHSNRANNAPYTIFDGSTALATVQVNQKEAPSDFVSSGTTWEELGTFTIAGPALVVRLTNAANDHVIADAIRLERFA